jgi:hypothetical protein
MCESSLEAHQINDAIDCADVVEQRWSVASYNNSAQHKHGSHGGNVGPPHGCTTAARVLRQGPDCRALTYSAGPSPLPFEVPSVRVFQGRKRKIKLSKSKTFRVFFEEKKQLTG